ncbi:MAG: sigma-70 family RNA polymerase sigma factor [Daejeonella sp.]|uniref:RNA polymerase sigma factor n=1 Tax=Daejeonella sp. TaxID=2805397 RepID=UPI003C76E089
MSARKVHTVEDSLLLIKLSEGSKPAFDELFERYWRDVLDEAYKRIGDQDQAKDIAQEVFISMWTRGTESRIENLPAWLYTVTKNHVYKAIQKQELFVPIPDLLYELEGNHESADAEVLGKEIMRTYEVLLDSLPDQQRLIFKMRYQEDLRPDEIALKLQLSPKTIRNHLGRAILKLKTAFLLFILLVVFAGN